MDNPAQPHDAGPPTATPAKPARKINWLLLTIGVGLLAYSLPGAITAVYFGWAMVSASR